MTANHHPSLPTAEEISHHCVAAAYKAVGKGNPWRNAAWHALQDYATEHHGYDRDDRWQTAQLRRRFYATANCGSPENMLKTKIRQLNLGGLTMSQALATLYHDPLLDLIDGEGHFWLNKLSEEEGLNWAEPHTKNQLKQLAPKKASPRPLSPQRRFVLRIKELQDDLDLSRREAYKKIHAEFAGELERDRGLFMTHWPFDEEELSALVTMFEEDTNKIPKLHRRELFGFLITEQITDPGDPREMQKFVETFLKVSPLPLDELKAEIEKGYRIAGFNRPYVRAQVEKSFRDRLLPGEFDHVFDKIWRDCVTLGLTG
ncbi:hypothetical protein H6761_03585 [Candidatus Nomurabacteria bacterium]|nr:hypothetical protein [Candidatus Nomurabacteria bacterium]